MIDTGQPRNRFAAASHGFLGQDGENPLEILRIARAQLTAYPTVRIVEDEATAATAIDGGFAVTLAGGAVLEARKLILAFGLRDELPAIPGLRERWGKTVLHCPYCHGIEFSDQPLGVLYRSPMSAQKSLLIAEWGPTTLYLNGTMLDAETEARLKERGVAIEPAPVVGLDGDGSNLTAAVLEDGRRVPTSALYVIPDTHLSSPLAAQLGVAIDESPLGPLIRTDADKLTTVPGVYAAGDIARAPHSVSWAVGDGVTAGTAAHRALVFG